MKRLVLAFAILLSPPCFGQEVVYARFKASAAGGVVIARTGNCTGATTSCTFSATATGDLKIIFAYRSGSTTAPSLPAGWTTITTVATASTGTTGAVRIGCNVSSSSGDTGSGTWTNATDVVGISYSGTNVGTTANCNITGVGAFATNQAKASTTINYAALTMQDTSGGSWVAGFAGTNLANSGAPSGMTSVTTAGTGPAAIASDTNATASSWSSTNVTQSSGTWLTGVLEILVQQGFTLIQNPIATGCSGTTCAVTLTQSVTAGNLLVVATQFAGSNVTISSIDKGGSITTCTSSLGGTPNGSSPMGYVLSASSATTPITITYSATSATINAAIYEFRPNSGVTPAVDTCNELAYPSGVTPVAPTFTLSGTKGVRIDTCATANNCTVASNPFGLQSVFNSGNGWTSWEKIPTAATAGPTWTLSGAGGTSLGAIAFSTGATSCINEGFQGFEGGSNNTAVTEALMRPGNFGWSGLQWGFTGTAMKFQTAASHNLLNTRTRMCGDGTQALSSGSTLGVEYLTSAGANSYITGFFKTNGTVNGFPLDNVSAGVWYFSDVPDNNANSAVDIFSITGYAGADFATAQNLANAGITKRCLHVESSLGQDTGCIDINTSTWYWLSLEYNKAGNAVLKVYDASGSLVGTSTKAMAGTTQPGNIALGNLSATVPTTGFRYYFDGLVINLGGGTLTP